MCTTCNIVHGGDKIALLAGGRHEKAISTTLENTKEVDADGLSRVRALLSPAQSNISPAELKLAALVAAGLLEVGDDSLTELAGANWGDTFHLGSKVRGDLLGADSACHALDNKVSRLVPA